MSEVTDIEKIFHILASDDLLPELFGIDHIRLTLIKAMAFYAKKPYQVDAFNALKDSVESLLQAKSLILAKSIEEN